VEDKRPNIVFILIDDMGWKDLACTGSEFYETPNIDRLCAEGMRFTDAYASCPVCSPTRASILAGKYPARIGVTNYIGEDHAANPPRGRLIDAPYTDHLPIEEVSLATALREGGYRTWQVGKWHLGGPDFYPEKHGFDVSIGGCEWGHPRGGYFAPYGHLRMPQGPEGEYLTDRLTAEACDLIRQPDERPFFLYLSHYAVHTPIQAPAELIRKYEAKAKAMGLDQVPTFEEGEAFPCLHKKGRRVRRRLVQSDPAYAAMVENLDWNVGRVLAALDVTGPAENTIVIFTSDNGGLSTAESSPTCNLPLSEGKGWMYEGGTREPLFVRWPGVIEPASVCTTPMSSPDFYPTLLEAVGLPLRPEQHVDGVSLGPLLRQTGDVPDRPLFWHYPHHGNQGGSPGCSVRCGDWKLIEFFEDGARELYNLREDEGETNNLAESEPEKVAELAATLATWLADVEAKIPQPDPNFDPWPDRGCGHHYPAS
jgi:arylsulfatase A-like enzyme